MQFVYNDGGRKAAGFQGKAGDCVARSIAIATGLPYTIVYDRLANGNADQRSSRHSRSKSSHGVRTASHGIWTTRKWFLDYMHELGFVWTPTMLVGQGCKVHLHDNELPMGRLIAKLSKHYTAVIDGVINDTYDPRREVHCIRPLSSGPLKPGEWINENGVCSVSRRCVYGYWKLERSAQ